MSYQRVPARTDLRRPYTVTLGLAPGYEALAAVGAHDAVFTAHAGWMIERADAGLPYLTGVFHEALVCYLWPRPDAGGPPPTGDGLASVAAAVGSSPVAAREEGLVFAGEVSVLYAAAVTDEQVTDMLDELAARLAAAAGQERVYVAFRDRCWVLEHHPDPAFEPEPTLELEPTS